MQFQQSFVVGDMLELWTKRTKSIKKKKTDMHRSNIEIHNFGQFESALNLLALLPANFVRGLWPTCYWEFNRGDEGRLLPEV